MGVLSKGGNWWSHKISHKGPDGGEELAGSRAAHRGSLSAAKRWVGMYGGKGSDLMAAANGDRETDRLAAQILKSTLYSDLHLVKYTRALIFQNVCQDKRAKKALRSGCHGLDCLFTAAAKAASHDGLSTGGALSSAMKQLDLGGGSGGSSGGITASDFGKEKTATHTGMHYAYRLDHLSMTHGGTGIPKMHAKNGVNVPGQGDVGPDVAKSKIGKAGNSLASRRSTHDTDVEVRSQEASDLKESMQEALVDYKKLLKHEVKKEELRTVNDPTLAIETPIGKPLLPTLSGGTNENPANLEMDALKGETSTGKVGDICRTLFVS
jgi:hypothetical protein